MRRLFPSLTLEEERKELRLLVLGIRHQANELRNSEEHDEYQELLAWHKANPHVEERIQAELEAFFEEIKRLL